MFYDKGPVTRHLLEETRMSMQIRIALFGQRPGSCHRLITEMRFYSVEAGETSYNEVVEFAADREIELFLFMKGLPNVLSTTLARSILRDRDYLSEREGVEDVAIH